MTQKVGVQHVVLLIIRKRLLGWQQIVKGNYLYKLKCFGNSATSKNNIQLLFCCYHDHFGYRLVAEMNMEKKFKTQKGKTKNSEGRKQLSSVRVIQRNLVYIVGLPLNLADEEV